MTGESFNLGRGRVGNHFYYIDRMTCYSGRVSRQSNHFDSVLTTDKVSFRSKAVVVVVSFNIG